MDRLHIDRKNGGKGLRAARDVVKQECVMIANYTREKRQPDGNLEQVPKLNEEYSPTVSH